MSPGRLVRAKPDERRRRELASERRAGSHLRRKIIEDQLQLIRSTWKAWLIMLGVYASGVIVLLLPVVDPVRQFALGAWTATIIWLSVLLVWQLSGVGHLVLGRLGEQWTVQELRPLRRRGWLLINNARFKKWDVDHILIGPAGVVVIETKGGRTDWAESRWTNRLGRDAVRVPGASDGAVCGCWPSADDPTTVAP